MTFRPSVLPDRDNDILSTFTRSFERARQLVRQDQADKRAQQIHDLEVREREQALADQELSANLEIATTPGLSFRDISSRQAEIANLFGRNADGSVDAEVQAPMIGRFGRASMPRELMPPPGTPGDVQIVGQRGGQTLTFSQTMADRIRRDRALADAQAAERLPEAVRAAGERDDLAVSVRNILGLDPILGADGQPIPAEQIPSTELGRDLIETRHAERLARARGEAVAAVPRTSTSGGGRSPDEIRLGQARGRILSSFRSRLAAFERTIPAPGSMERRMLEARGQAVPEADRAGLMREAINEAQAVGDITETEANDMRQQIPQMLEQAGASAAGSQPPPQATLSPAEVQSIVGMLRRAGSISEAEIREDLEAEGFTEDDIQAVLDAM